MTQGEFVPIPRKVEDWARSIVDSAFQVHSGLGPGLIESVYEACLVHELSKRSIMVESQVILPIVYDGILLDAGLRLDLRVENSVIVDPNVVTDFNDNHIAQMIGYLAITDLKLALQLNFKFAKLGIRRVVREIE